ncbi:hypothetical protein AFR_30810 [Actinoplanes friuliensis DSM 7358]|uniref:Uncharacterized protein n=2 Tax=Actinoplanes friuliensis TaxID=196914 RepID=U5W5Y2_9ACTN|nr:hypothetical protein AFR_30810 [Actinoplanes friuliensis DSM 7358]
MAVAFLAVLVAVGSLGVAGWAVHRANVAVAASERLTVAAPAAGQPTPEPPAVESAAPAPSPTTEASTETSTGEESGGEAPTLSPTAVFTVQYEKRKLSVQMPANRCSSRSIDLDEPQLDVGGYTNDLEVKGTCSGTMTLNFGQGVSGAADAEDLSTTPKACNERIQLSALPRDEPLPLRKGQVLCVRTSSAQAKTLGISQKMTLVNVTGVGATGLVTLEVTAWNVPV